ncbi:FlgB family protein [Aestuariibius sp. 2305UL40-4]|uniref:FlgB family protein n=1 Tax=Aestuariibius violaceus TaxID=3234132 RepID=UPI00346FBCEC
MFRIAFDAARHAGQRQAVVARNVANADTPGYRSQDIEPFSLSATKDSFAPKSTRQGHLSATEPARLWSVSNVAEPGSMSPNGNDVSLETEMLRAIDADRQHNRALAVYRHAMTVLRTSLGR